MEERELRRLNRRDLLQMLLVQCEETERLQKETDEMRAQMSVITESYERLKKKLDVKDERLNQKDAKIAELNREIEEREMSEGASAEGAGSVVAAVNKLNEAIEEVRKTVRQYGLDSPKNPFEAGRASTGRRKRDTASRQIIPLFGQEGRLERDAAVGDIHG